MKAPKIIVTAGPTREPIDPVRFISNYSTGFMGYSIAKEAIKKGWRVLLISGPTVLKAPREAKVINVVTAEDMERALLKNLNWADCIVMSAAVSDFRPAAFSSTKIKREGISRTHNLILNLKENPDILKDLGKRKGNRILVGFALETENLLKNAKKKLRKKNLDFIVANRLAKNKSVFGNVSTSCVIIDRLNNIERIKSATKPKVASLVVKKIEDLLKAW